MSEYNFEYIYSARGRLIAADYYQAANLGFPILHDDQLAIAKSFGIEQMAESVVVSPSLQVLYRGGIKTEKDEMILFQALEAIAKGQEPAQKVGDGIGCFLLYPDQKNQKYED